MKLKQVWETLGVPEEKNAYEREVWLLNQCVLAQVSSVECYKTRDQSRVSLNVKLEADEVICLSALFDIYAVISNGKVYVLCLPEKNASRELAETIVSSTHPFRCTIFTFDNLCFILDDVKLID